MAIAKREAEEQNKFKTKSVTLTLSPHEVWSLLLVLRSIGGSPYDTPRIYLKEVTQAIESALSYNHASYNLGSEFISSGMTLKGSSLEDFLAKVIKLDNLIV